jgi:hypothetical protein
MPAPHIDQDLEFRDALQDIRKILDSVHPHAKPGEKLVRIGWVIAALPTELRDTIIGEVQKRVLVGWTEGKTPTDW